MEVTSKREFVTHAVIGKHAPIEFGISDNPEFFQVLSKALYSDQHLAVVREVMCNAWDAHIEAGVTHKPIQVFMKDGYLFIRDFGHGIPLEMIGQIYGVYGLSTRVKDAKVTGGFGLGCKAPFAYTEHFEVTSWNQGTRTIYSLSRSSAQANGRPSIVPIVSTPTEETGLQVKVKIESHEDGVLFKQLAERIACNGGMHAEVEGKLVETLNLGTEGGEYVITSRVLHKNGIHNSINVRYGTVIYPVPNEKAYKADYDKIRDFLGNFIGVYGNYAQRNTAYHLVLQAPPGSLSVTPSRETLSMQEKTITALTGMFRNFSPVFSKAVPNRAKAQIEEGNVKLIKEDEHDKLLCQLDKPTLEDFTYAVKDITSINIMARFFIQKNYSGQMVTDDRRHRLELLSRSTYRNRGTIQTLQKEFNWEPENEFFTKKSRRFLSWFQHHILRKLYRDLEQVQKQGWQKLFVFHRHTKGLISSHKLAMDSPDQWIPFARKVVVLCYAQKDFFEEAVHFPELKKLGQLEKGTFVYTVQRGKQYAEIARQVFTKHGFYLLDLTQEVSWRIPEEPEDREPREPRLKGWPVLYSLFSGSSTKEFLPSNGLKENAPRILTPDFSARFEKDRYANTHSIVGFDTSATLSILQHLGGVGALCVSTTQEAAMLKKDIRPCSQFITEKVLWEMENNPRIVEHLPYDLKATTIQRKDSHSKVDSISMINTLMWHPHTRALFGIVDNRNKMDRFWCRMWRAVQKAHSSSFRMNVKAKDSPVVALHEKLNKVSLAPEALALLDAVDNNPVLKLFDPTELRQQLTITRTASKAVAILTEALKG